MAFGRTKQEFIDREYAECFEHASKEEKMFMRSMVNTGRMSKVAAITWWLNDCMTDGRPAVVSICPRCHTWIGDRVVLTDHLTDEGHDPEFIPPKREKPAKPAPPPPAAEVKSITADGVRHPVTTRPSKSRYGPDTDKDAQTGLPRLYGSFKKKRRLLW
jgi:hypothetical protein